MAFWVVVRIVLCIRRMYGMKFYEEQFYHNTKMNRPKPFVDIDGIVWEFDQDDASAMEKGIWF